MKIVKRLLQIDLPEQQSAFLWGPRKTGKSTYLQNRFPNSLVYDFLDTDLFLEFSKKPSLLRQQLLAKPSNLLDQPIILDEVQKIPAILDEIHWLIEKKRLRFVLCGSSARKLKRGQANLLGGRAWRYELFPLVSAELENIDLMKSLNQGMVPLHYLQDEKACKKSLKAYVRDYLKEEVFDEGLTRNIPAFSRFLDAVGYSHAEMINYSNIARDCGVDSKTVKEYYQILVDTLLGTLIEPFKRRQSRRVITKAPKFYLFDVGVAGYITKRTIVEEKGEQFGKALEHFIFTEINAYRAYYDLDFPINFWRTQTGIEVDFILGQGEVALEIKGTSRIDKSHLLPLLAFKEGFSPKKAILVCNEKTKRNVQGIIITPWKEFLSDLWHKKII